MLINLFKIYKSILFILPLILFSSCFTGVESTKKIKLTREERKIIKPSEEEIFFEGIKGIPLEAWEEGHPFYVTDNKAILIFEPQGLPIDIYNLELEGKTINYTGVESRVDAAGNILMVIDFSDGQHKLPYNTGKPFDTAMASFLSNQIPVIIDLKMVDEAREKLKGVSLWIKTLLWYDENGERIDGRKFVPVTIQDVMPGNMVFPLRVKFSDEKGDTAWLYMNMGNSGTESRSFHHLFSMTDLRKKYPSISDDNWKAICEGNILPGMTKEECRLALGNPTNINSGHDYSQTLDMWNYENGTILWFEDGLLSKFRK